MCCEEHINLTVILKATCQHYSLSESYCKGSRNKLQLYCDAFLSIGSSEEIWAKELQPEEVSWSEKDVEMDRDST